MNNVYWSIIYQHFYRVEAKQWFATKVEELSGMNLTEKAVKQTILSAIRSTQ